MDNSGKQQNLAKESNQKHSSVYTLMDDVSSGFTEIDGNGDTIKIAGGGIQDYIGSFCPNCGARLEAQKCKLFCRTRGCGYLVTCSEW